MHGKTSSIEFYFPVPAWCGGEFLDFIFSKSLKLGIGCFVTILNFWTRIPHGLSNKWFIISSKWNVDGWQLLYPMCVYLRVYSCFELCSEHLRDYSSFKSITEVDEYSSCFCPCSLLTQVLMRIVQSRLLLLRLLNLLTIYVGLRQFPHSYVNRLALGCFCLYASKCDPTHLLIWYIKIFDIKFKNLSRQNCSFFIMFELSKIVITSGSLFKRQSSTSSFSASLLLIRLHGWEFIMRFLCIGPPPSS